MNASGFLESTMKNVDPGRLVREPNIVVLAISWKVQRMNLVDLARHAKERKDVTNAIGLRIVRMPCVLQGRPV